MYRNFNLDNFISNHVTCRADSLLKADLEKYNELLLERIEGKSALVIGGAGSIGSSYIKALLKYKVKKLIVVDINENGLTELVRDLRSSTSFILPDVFITYPINFADKVFLKLFKAHGPFEIVANFAAHKHVRSEKDVYSIEAMIENNVIRAKELLDFLLENRPEHFFCVSTDKAANPVNIMGATKKLMEELIMSYSDRIPITTARFANVAFSNGSLPQGFLTRISKKQPWSCPKDLRRFFVSPQESGELCLIANLLGESGDIFYPKLDEEKDMIPFDVIANRLLDELELEPDICESEIEAREKANNLSDIPTTWPVYFFDSDTSGEKAYEEFYTDEEELEEDLFINLGVIKKTKKRELKEIEKIIENLKKLTKKGNITKTEIVDILKEYLPNFNHIETGKGLDSKM